MSTSLLYHTQGIEGYQHLRHEYTSGTHTWHIIRPKSKLQCSACNSFNVRATLVAERRIKTLPMGKLNCEICVKMHRLLCRDCKAWRMEKVDFKASGSRITRTMERTIIDLRNHMTISALADYMGLHWETVKNVEKKHLENKYKTIPLAKVKAIGIDEVHMGATIGDKGFLTIVRDLHTGAVLFVAEGKNGACLDPFAARLKRSKAKIEAVAVDLAPSFTSWIKKNLPEVNIVYDRFHVIKLMNERIDKIRRRTMNSLEDYEKKELKGMRWYFLLNRENLSMRSAQKLHECKQIFDELGTAYMLKETLRNVYSMADNVSTAEMAFTRWCKIANESAIPEMVSIAKTIIKNIKGILGFWSTGGLTSASMEGFNNKVGWLTRMAYGYRDQDYLKLKIYDLPNLKMNRVI